MISAFLPLILLAYGTVEAEGSLAFLPCTFVVIWLWFTLLSFWMFIPDYLERKQNSNETSISFLTAQAIFQWAAVIWIIALQAFSAPGKLLFQSLEKILPQSWPMLISTALFIWLQWLSRSVFLRAFRAWLNPDQSPSEFFRARMTLPILFFPPMLLWMLVEDLWLGQASFSGISDLQTFVLAPLFFVGLYLLSPHLFNFAWRATPMPDEKLCQQIIDLSHRVETPITGVRVWDTFKEPLPNAAVAGLSARFRFVYITRYLLDLFPSKEILAIIAHELGHLRLGHVWTYLIFSLDLVFLSLFLKLQLFFRLPWLILRYESLESTADLLVFLAIFLFLFTRLTRHSELQADRFAATATDGTVFAGTLRVLQEFITPPPTWTPSWLLTHPEFDERIKAATTYKGTMGQLIEQAKRTRLLLLALGLLLLFLSWPSAHQVMKLSRAAAAIEDGDSPKAMACLHALPLETQEHPVVLELLGKAAAKAGQWPLVLYFSAMRSFENLGRIGPPLEVFEHAVTPVVALHFQIVEFLLQALDLRRVHGVSLFDKIFYHIQIAFGQG